MQTQFLRCLQKDRAGCFQLVLFNADFQFGELADARHVIKRRLQWKAFAIQAKDATILADNRDGAITEQDQQSGELLGRVVAVAQGDFDFRARLGLEIALGPLVSDEVPRAGIPVLVRVAAARE